MSPSRRSSLATLFAVVAALVLTLTGCGQPAAPASNEPTRTITDATGKPVTVPVDPKRVVVLHESDLDATLALGVKPVGLTNGRMQQGAPRYLAGRANGIPIVGDINAPTAEKVAELQPDLILAAFISDQQVLDQMRRITPAVVITTRADEDWKTTFTRIGTVLNKADRAKSVLADYDTKAKGVKDKLGPNAGAKVSIVRWNPQGPSYMQDQSFASLVLGDVGLTRPAAQTEKHGFAPTDPLSLENIQVLDGDWMFLGTLNADGQKTLDSVRSTPAFQQLAAVRNQHLVSVDGSIWTSRGGPLAADVVLTDAHKALAKS